jgi:hypothetical protein
MQRLLYGVLPIVLVLPARNKLVPPPASPRLVFLLLQRTDEPGHRSSGGIVLFLRVVHIFQGRSQYAETHPLLLTSPL